MTPTEIIVALRRRGILLAPTGDGRLRYRPRHALAEAERVVLARHGQEILALLAANPVGWRAAVMATQLPNTGAIPLLLARPEALVVAGTCCSCGDSLALDDRYRCRPCAEAAIAVVGQHAAVTE